MVIPKVYFVLSLQQFFNNFIALLNALLFQFWESHAISSIAKIIWMVKVTSQLSFKALM